MRWPCLLPQHIVFEFGDIPNLEELEPNLKSSCSNWCTTWLLQRSQIFMVSSFDVETTYLSSGVNLTQATGSKCACSIFSIMFFYLGSWSLIEPSLWPETTLVSDLEMCMSKHLEMVLMDLTMRSEVMSQNLIEQSSEAVIAWWFVKQNLQEVISLLWAKMLHLGFIVPLRPYIVALWSVEQAIKYSLS